MTDRVPFRITALLLFFLASVRALTGCISSYKPPQTADFKKIDRLTELEGVYQNLGLSKPGQSPTYLSALIWPTQRDHSAVTAVEVRAHPSGRALLVRAFRGECAIRESVFVQGRDFDIRGGRIRLKKKTSFVGGELGDSLVGTEYEKSELGLDQEGHGKYRGVAFESGLAFLIIPLAAGTVEEVRFVRLSTATIPPQVDPRHLAQCEHDRGLYEESIVYCNQWILTDPTDWRGYHLLGMNHQALGRYQEAIEAFQRAASIAPQSPSPRSSLDSVYVQMARHQEAVAALEEAVRIEPGLQQAHSDLGRAYWALNRREEAIEAYKRASLIKPDDAAALYSLGRACSQVGRSDEAIEAYEKVQRILPWFEPSLPRDLGILYFQAGRYEEALMMLEEAIGIKRDDIDARYYLGLTHARMGNKTLALGQYETLRKLNEDRAGELLSEIAR